MILSSRKYSKSVSSAKSISNVRVHLLLISLLVKEETSTTLSANKAI